MLGTHLHRGVQIFLACLALVFWFKVMAQAQLGIAPIQPDQVGEFITCHVGGRRIVLRPDKSLIFATSFAPNNVEMQKIFDEVARYTELRSNIYTVPVLDRINVQICPGDSAGRNYIAYSPAWLQEIYGETHSKWVLYAIIAHEIGHYALAHDRTSLGSNPEIELKADEYAGGILARMGASIADAQVAYRSRLMASLVSHTHPPIDQRLDAVARGWGQVAGARPSTGTPSSTPTSTVRPRYNQARGVLCRTTDGRRYRC